MFAEEPLFLKNREWYVVPEDEGLDDMFFPDGRGYHIRDDAPDEAKRSYDAFYNPDDMIGEDGKPLRKKGYSVHY